MSSQEDQIPSSEYAFTMDARLGVYELDWPNLNISARVERIKLNREGDPKGEVTLESRRPLASGQMELGGLILNSTTSKKTLAKALSDRDPEILWDNVVQQLATAVLKRYRKGAEVMAVDGDENPVQARRYLIHPIIQVGNPTVIYGKGASGKSYMAQYMSVLAHEGKSTNGLTVEAPASVLYLDYETDYEEISVRVAMIRRGMGLPVKSAPGFWYRSMAQSIESDIVEIQELVRKHDVNFLVVDSVGSAAGGEGEESKAVLNMFDSIASLGVTSLLIDHKNKMGVLHGSEYKFNRARLLFEVRAVQEEESPRIDLAMYHEKFNNSAKIKPLGWALTFDDETEAVSIARTDPEAAFPSTRRLIKDALVGGKMTFQEIVSEVVGPKTTRDDIREALDNNPSLFIKFEDGYYGNVAYQTERSGPPPGVRKWEI